MRSYIKLTDEERRNIIKIRDRVNDIITRFDIDNYTTTTKEKKFFGLFGTKITVTYDHQAMWDLIKCVDGFCIVDTFHTFPPRLASTGLGDDLYELATHCRISNMVELTPCNIAVLCKILFSDVVPSERIIHNDS